MKLLNEILKEIKPTKEEEKEVKSTITNFISNLNKGLKNAKAILGGSGAKGTWLSKAHDADIFVQFNYKKYKDKSSEIANILEKHLKKKFTKISRLHGSRDYFQIKQKSYTFEIIPILKITKAEQAQNITDVSPLHANWVRKSKKLPDEIRLTKQFCKAQGVYGAESYIRGLSGYICEILTINYGGFLKLLRAAAKWEPKTVIDTVGYYKNRNDILFSINKSKQEGPLLLIDPVQKDRNAAAAVSTERFEQFIQACRKFLKKPSKASFKEKEITTADLKKQAGKNNLIILNITAKKGKKDVVGSKLLKVFEFLGKRLEKNDFKVINKGWKWDKNKEALFWFVFDKKSLSTYVERKGPPLKFPDAVKDFKKKHKSTSIKKRCIFAKDKRTFTEADKCLKYIIKDQYVKDKVSKISL